MDTISSDPQLLSSSKTKKFILIVNSIMVEYELASFEYSKFMSSVNSEGITERVMIMRYLITHFEKGINHLDRLEEIIDARMRVKFC